SFHPGQQIGADVLMGLLAQSGESFHGRLWVCRAVIVARPEDTLPADKPSASEVHRLSSVLPSSAMISARNDRATAISAGPSLFKDTGFFCGAPARLKVETSVPKRHLAALRLEQ